MNGPEMLEVSVWIWDFLVMGVLPVISAAMMLYFTIKILEAGKVSSAKLFKRFAKGR